MDIVLYDIPDLSTSNIIETYTIENLNYKNIIYMHDTNN